MSPRLIAICVAAFVLSGVALHETRKTETRVAQVTPPGPPTQQPGPGETLPPGSAPPEAIPPTPGTAGGNGSTYEVTPGVGGGSSIGAGGGVGGGPDLNTPQIVRDIDGGPNL